ncbi:hypothetical protein SAMN06295909_3451 [Plantibacter sp. VKM Ac-1784]|uniref:LPXTG-motif cell wall-anchored protein n=1 Tax=Plantibacter elymi (nom. nud.) TaxID=199708 RepID=A0ABY1RGR8_9MICO|nr:hypothetical protein [Plantibacter sp. VKM Ac-1784]SMQ73821.1 hypothetical protein SAMN06295909_3451 [Plantibacter sp. VKM Ac-1784]
MNLKTSRRTAALATGLAVVAGSTLLIAGPASAAEIQVTADQIAPNEANYAGWHEGVATPGAPAVLSDAGLTMTGDSQIIYGFNNTGGVPVEAGGFLDAAASISYASVEDDLYFQIPVFADGTSDTFTTLRPVAPGVENLGGDWVVSQNVPGLATDATYTPAELSEALGDFNLLAFGVFANAGTVDTLQSVTFGADTYNFAAPVVAPDEPSVAINPETIFFSDVRPGGSGFTVTIAGFTPGDTLSIAVTDPNGEIFGAADGGNTFIADENGGAVLPGLTLQGEGIQVGTYTFTVTDTAGVPAADSIAVIADPVAAGAPVPTLADTGSDSGVLVGGAAALLLLGAAGMLFAAARRKGAQVTA